MPLFHVGSLWKQESKDGVPMLKGTASGMMSALFPGMRFLILPNDKKEAQNSPTHKLFIATDDEQGEDKKKGDYKGKGSNYKKPQRAEETEEVPF